VAVKNQNVVYKQFTEGKISKQDLKVIVEKSEKEQNELHQIKLRKVKIERIRQETEEKNEIDDSKPKSIKDLLSVFGGNGAVAKKPAVIVKKTVIEEGNLRPMDAKKRAGGVASSDQNGPTEDVTQKKEPVEQPVVETPQVVQKPASDPAAENSSDEEEVPEINLS